jgi:RNA polymerase sigma factor (sigma-70 family)
VLTDSHQAQDAFQGTFLVLVQQAGSVRHKDSVASWLYGVAYRLACCSVSAETRRKRHERRFFAERRQVGRQSEPERTELGAIVHEELNRLPDPYRLVIVLCDLEELTQEQAAARLGWPVGTVKSRLTRRRERLRARLTRRGLAPTSGLIAVFSSGSEAPAFELPPSVLESAIGTALAFDGGPLDAGKLPTGIEALLERVTRAMWWNALRSAAMTLAAMGALVFAATMFWKGTMAGSQGSPSGPGPVVQPRIAEEAIWAKNQENLKRIGIAFHNYHRANGHFPAVAITGKAGEPLLSWRVAILPFLEDLSGQRDGEALLNQFRRDQAWDSPHNRMLLARMPRVYASPRDRSANQTTTVYRGIAGTGTMFEGEQGIKLNQVIDGSTRTLMVAKAADPVPWTKPEELTCVGQPPPPRPGALREGEFAALFASGHVRLIEPRNLLSAFITRQGREPAYLEFLRINEHPPSPDQTSKKSRGVRGQTDVLNRPGMEAYSRAKTLTDALAILVGKLDKDGVQEFKPLLTEARVRGAILAYVLGLVHFLVPVAEPGLPVPERPTDAGRFEGFAEGVVVVGTRRGIGRGEGAELAQVDRPAVVVGPLLDLGDGGLHHPRAALMLTQTAI